MLFKCKHFKIYELVDKATYKKWGQASWWFLDSRLLQALDKLRDELGPITVNNWKWGGPFQWRGLRTSKYYNGKVAHSQHLFGRAFDFDVKGMSAYQVRKHLRSKYAKYGITTIEKKVNWVHMDIRNCNPLKQVSP